MGHAITRGLFAMAFGIATFSSQSQAQINRSCGLGANPSVQVGRYFNDNDYIPVSEMLGLSHCPGTRVLSVRVVGQSGGAGFNYVDLVVNGQQLEPRQSFMGSPIQLEFKMPYNNTIGQDLQSIQLHMLGSSYVHSINVVLETRGQYPNPGPNPGPGPGPRPGPRPGPGPGPQPPQHDQLIYQENTALSSASEVSWSAQIGPQFGRFTSLNFEAQNAHFNVSQLVIYYRNGEVDNLSSMSLPVGSSRTIRLRNPRFIDYIAITGMQQPVYGPFGHLIIRGYGNRQR